MSLQMTAVYDRSAKYYDALNWYRDYEAQTSILDKIFSMQSDRKVRKVLDLGCGTGTHAVGLARLGYEVWALDNSSEMLRIGRTKMGLKKAHVNFVRANLPVLKIPAKFDAAYSLFSVVNMLDLNRLDALLHSVREHLMPGGVLVFDFWTPQSGTYYPMSWIWAKMGKKRILRLTEMSYDEDKKVESLTRHHLVFDRTRLIDEFEERLKFRLYTLAEVLKSSSEAGFKITARFEGTMQSYRLRKPSESAMIILAVAKRN